MLCIDWAFGSEADLAIPDLHNGTFPIILQPECLPAFVVWFFGYFGYNGYKFISAWSRLKKCTAHKSMLDVAETIFQTCRTYLIQQGKFLLMLFAFIAIAMLYYFLGLNMKLFQWFFSFCCFQLLVWLVLMLLHGTVSESIHMPMHVQLLLLSEANHGML